MAPLDSQEETYPCTLCDKSFSNVDAFCKHLGSHMDVEDCESKAASQETKIVTPLVTKNSFSPDQIILWKRAVVILTGALTVRKTSKMESQERLVGKKFT